MYAKNLMFWGAAALSGGISISLISIYCYYRYFLDSLGEDL